MNDLQKRVYHILFLELGSMNVDYSFIKDNIVGTIVNDCRKTLNGDTSINRYPEKEHFSKLVSSIMLLTGISLPDMNEVLLELAEIWGYWH